MIEIKENGNYKEPEEPSKKRKFWAWLAAVGLQAPDNLKPSKYLYQLAERNIEGELTYEEVVDELKHYYEENKPHRRESEADFSATRIAEILTTEGFVLSPATLTSYHRHLFSDDPHFQESWTPGEYRKRNITKKEAVLAGESVQYSPAFAIADRIDYDFAQEAKLDYQELEPKEKMERILDFISKIWHSHPFNEGNTRTIAVFTIMYLRELGFEVENELFKDYSKYFRDALALDNAPQASGLQDRSYLRKFFENLILGQKHDLLRTEMTKNLLS